MKTTEFTTTILKPDEGKYLTQKAADVEIKDRIIATTIALGKNDSIDNYIEIDAETAEEYKRLQREAYEIDAKIAFEKSSVK